MRRLRCERGSAMVVVMAVMSVMLMSGFATLEYVDAQQNQAGGERRSESSFNLAEAALNTQAFVLSRDWPGTGDAAYPAACTQAQGGRGCPENSRVNAGAEGVDLDGSAAWQTEVHDNTGTNPNFYDPAVVNAQPAWDANGDNRVWVRAEGVAQGRRRAIVALVRVEVIEEQMPLNAITAGHFSTNNNGNKVIVDTKGRPLAVRCRSVNNPRCLGIGRPNQISPPGVVQDGYTGGNALTEDAIDRLRTRAISLGTYYANGCPASPAGPAVFVERGDCSYNGGTINSQQSPGALVIMNGTLYLGGNVEYYGLVYMGNRQNSTGNVITMRGTSLIYGSVAVDGTGGMEAGSSKENVIFDPGPLENLRSYGSAGIVQNSWREVAPTAGQPSANPPTSP